jgi:hypothetical protein
MRKLLVCGALLAAIVPAAPAAAAKAKPLRACNTVGMAAKIQNIEKRGPSCADVRVAIRSVESHAAQCQPYRQGTIAPFRECTVTPALSTGPRNFFCRSAYETQGDGKRWWRTTCKNGHGDTITYRRDGNAA